MASSEPLIQATTLRGLGEFLERKYQVSLDELLTEVGITSRPPWEEAPPVSLRKFAALLELAAVRVKDDCLGLSFAEVFPPKAIGVLGFLIANAPDMREFMACLQRYVRLHIDGVSLSFEAVDGLLKINWLYEPTMSGPRKQLTEFLMSLFMKRAMQLYGSDIKPVSAEFEYRAPTGVERYYNLYGKHLRFGCPKNSLITRAEVMGRRCASADPDLYGIMRTIADRQLREIATDTDIVTRISKAVVRQLSAHDVTLESVANRLDMTSRQVQAQLKRRGTTFEIEVARVRGELAERYLRETDLSMTEIALMLGFSELSSFTRAARQWFGMPPTQYRDRARSHEAPRSTT